MTCCVTPSSSDLTGHDGQYVEAERTNSGEVGLSLNMFLLGSPHGQKRSINEYIGG